MLSVNGILRFPRVSVLEEAPDGLSLLGLLDGVEGTPRAADLEGVADVPDSGILKGGLARL